MTKSLEIQQFPLWDKLTAKRAPLSFDLELTGALQQRLPPLLHQPAGRRPRGQGGRAHGRLNLDIAREAAGMGAMWCLLTGGEPLLRDDFEDIYLGLKRQGLLVSVFTNACLVTPAHIDLFRKYPPSDIEVTVYGVTRETYERVTRRPGSFDRFMRGLNLLMDSGIRIRLKAMAIQSNLHEQNEIAEFCRARTKDYYRFDPLLHLRFDGDPVRNDEIRAERLTPEQIVALERADEQRIKAMREQCGTLINEEFTHHGV